MKEQHTFENSVVLHQPSGEPHFDDERTILAARRVAFLVPVNKKLKHKQYCSLGVAFALAMFLGAAAGLISAYFKLRTVSESRLTVIAIAGQPTSQEPVAPTVSGETLTEESGADFVPALAAREGKPPKAVTPKRILTEYRTAHRPATRTTNRSLTSQPLSEDEELRRIRQAVLNDESHERQPRRANKREQRRDERNEQDLSSLDNLIEARRRP